MQTNLTHPKTQVHAFLADMYNDQYFPRPLVDKGKAILVELCAKLEASTTLNDAAVYALTHAATEEFNALGAEFEESGSELETAARESIASDVGFILRAYGFEHLDLEEAIAPRDW
jgi:Family of unknown function (DUF5713)